MIPVGGSETVTVALSETPVGVVAVIVAVPRFAAVVTAPVDAFTAATVASELLHASGTFATGALFASNAAAVSVAPAGATNVTVFGDTTRRVAFAPGPTYDSTNSCCGGAGSSSA